MTYPQTTIDRIRKGYYSAVYFNRTKEILLSEQNLTPVTMQIFQKKDDSILAGTDEVMELFRIGTGYFAEGEWIDTHDTIEIAAMKDGERLASREPVMHITGPYAYFAQLESLYLGVLARRTWVATNTHRAAEAACGKPVYFFADRFDDFLNQEGDGYAAHLGGAAGVCTEAHTARWGGTASGTIPHALIALHGGSTVAAAEAFAKKYPDMPLIALVDFDNDCVRTSLEVAKALGKSLCGVRIDTAETMVDASLAGIKDAPSGVSPKLAATVRSALDAEGFSQVKIIVSGGFTPEKIARFEAAKAPVDGYGVGSALVHGDNDFTADIVLVEGKPVAKVGRAYQTNARMERRT